MITDSHGFGMERIIREMDGSVDVLSLCYGKSTVEIIGKIRLETRNIISFNPDTLILHMGHNDIFEHEVKNPNPTRNTVAMEQIFDFYKDLKTALPNTRIMYSCMFPRIKVEPYSEKQITQYNHVALRMGRKAQQYDIKTIFVRELWINITQAQAAGRYLQCNDGLHLRTSGKEIVAGKWLDALYDRLSIPAPQMKKDKRKGAPGGAPCGSANFKKYQKYKRM